jgi:GT2 family glycosyltransferase
VTALRLCVLIPCRNEAAVIERKLANLARAEWPVGEHLVLVVDDGSDDGTRAVAERALDENASRLPLARCIDNRHQPGKAGAIATGLDEAGSSAKLIVLTDADVLQSAGSLKAFADAFEADEQLGMACGSQRFVHELARDGVAPEQLTGAGPAAAPWDRWTAAVRRFESRRGKLFSVHGQLLAWRTALQLRPRPEVAADDLDLVLSLRRSHPELAVRLLPDAVFFEAKPSADEAADGQALRRARAYVQALHHAGPVRGFQNWCYRVLPLMAPRLVLVGVLLVLFVSGLGFGPLGLAVSAACITLFALTGTGKHVLRLLVVIERARHAERREPLSTRWEMQR